MLFAADLVAGDGATSIDLRGPILDDRLAWFDTLGSTDPGSTTSRKLASSDGTDEGTGDRDPHGDRPRSRRGAGRQPFAGDGSVPAEDLNSGSMDMTGSPRNVEVATAAPSG
jgi:hypothetical protein